MTKFNFKKTTAFKRKYSCGGYGGKCGMCRGGNYGEGKLFSKEIIEYKDSNLTMCMERRIRGKWVTKVIMFMIHISYFNIYGTKIRGIYIIFIVNGIYFSLLSRTNLGKYHKVSFLWLPYGPGIHPLQLAWHPWLPYPRN